MINCYYVDMNLINPVQAPIMNLGTPLLTLTFYRIPLQITP